MYKYASLVIALIISSAISSVAQEEATAVSADVLEQQTEKSKNNSIRIRFGNAPGFDELEDDTGSYAIDDDGGSQFDVVYQRRFWSKNNPVIGGVFGGGIFFGNHSSSSGAVDLDVTTFGGLVEGGFAVKAGEVVVFEISPYLGAGIAENKTTGYTSGTGTIVIYGVKGGAYFALGSAIELGIEAGYGAATHDQEYEDSWGYTEDVTFTGSGAVVAGVLSIKF